MYVKRNYGFWMTFNWSKWPFIVGTAYGFVICLLSFFSKVDFSIPWSPISIMGIAVAFYLGFKNNSSYDRTWEARKIWGSIVNNSRTFGAAVVSFVQIEDSIAIQKELIYRHIAWLTVLRHQLRLSKPWEHIESRAQVYAPNITEDYNSKLDQELSLYISQEEIQSLENKANKATQLLKIQSQRFQELKDKSAYEDFRHMEFHKLVTTFYEDQGKSERIKNFPFPRQYASTALWMTIVFSFFVPFGLLNGFKDMNGLAYWLSPFLSGLIIWIFFLMEKIGDYSENPFEGSYNDVPITSIAKAIEIDLREMINDENIPKPEEEENGFLM
ncbi:bestrophin family ion channel [Reichenbachiella sp. MALMAid0571]|uniref:bestrophin family protein n=1 Tax=Reichenbachiella sp. MALMAid0571 TaxID=3143939 RepID=UPI0032DFC8E2